MMKKVYITFSIFLLVIGFGLFATPNKSEASFWDYVSINVGYNNYYRPYGYNNYYNPYGGWNSYNGYGSYGSYGNSYNSYYGTYGYGYNHYNDYYPSYGYGGNSSYYGDAAYPSYGQRGGGYNPCSGSCRR